MKTLSIIRCGNVGKTLGKLFHDAGVFTLQGIYNRTPEKTQESIDFIGAGTPISALEACPLSQVILIATSDLEIAPTADFLSRHLAFKNTIIFHCSGLLSSRVLGALAGNWLASVHPCNTFASPQILFRIAHAIVPAARHTAHVCA